MTYIDLNNLFDKLTISRTYSSCNDNNTRYNVDMKKTSMKKNEPKHSKAHEKKETKAVKMAEKKKYKKS